MKLCVNNIFQENNLIFLFNCKVKKINNANKSMYGKYSYINNSFKTKKND